MILRALNDYYQRLAQDKTSGISPPGYSREKISFEIVLDSKGRVSDVNDLRSSDKPPLPKSICVPQPEKRSVGIKPNFLWDKTSYVLGVSGASKRADLEHHAFKEMHAEVLADQEDTGLLAFQAFLDGWLPDCFAKSAFFHDEMMDANVVFRLDGEKCYLHDRPAAQAVRARLIDRGQNDRLSLCLVSGDNQPVARLHPAIKGVAGGQSSGTSIVSFNLESFESYGKRQGDNAPVSEKVAFAYTTALNYLLRRDENNRQRLRIGDTTVVFWTDAQDSAAGQLVADFFDPPSDDSQETRKLRDVLKTVQQGLPLRTLDPNLDGGTRIFVLGLAPNAARLSIRFWHVDTLQAFASRLAEHFQDLALEPSPFKTPPAVWRLLLATVPRRNDKSKSEDVPPHLAGELTRSILTGARYPRSLLSQLIMRLRADRQVTGVRVALCKAVLAREQRLSSTQTIKEIPVSLDTTNTDPGYLLGRLFSVLESVQRAALGSQINATIRDKYYGAASATPASVFPLLLRNTQNHLTRLRKDKPGFAVNLEKEIGEIVDRLASSFPRNLRIEAQGHFAIGYYHQSHARFNRAPLSENNDDNNDLALEGESA